MKMNQVRNSNIMQQISSWTIATVLLLLSTPISADTLLIEAINKAPENTPSGLLRPINGDTMDMVHNRFGAPVKELDPIGNPPITRWVYKKFTVYFEHNKVVNSAVHLGPN